MSDQTLKIDFSWRSTYFQALQLVQCFDIDPGTPLVAAILSVLCQEHDFASCRANLKNWLYEYIIPFALSPIRNEQNLEEKTLAIAVFIFLSKNDEPGERALPDEQLIKYIEYAEKQSWLNDSFLAFYCHFLRAQLTSCENVGEYFKTNYELFLQKKHAIAISQALIVLQNDLSNTEIQRGYNILIELLDNNELTSKQWAWVLWAFSKQMQGHAPFVKRLTSMIESEVTQLLDKIQRESGLATVFALMLADKNDFPVESYINKLKKTSVSEIGVSRDKNSYTLSIRPTSGDTTFSLSDLGLVLIALHQTHFDKIAYVEGLQNDKVSVLEHSLKLLNQGSIILNKVEKNIVNTLVIIFTIQVGALLLFLQMGRPTKISDIDFRWDYLVTLGVWLDYLFAQIKAAFLGNSAVDCIKNTLIIRHVFSLFTISKKK